MRKAIGLLLLFGSARIFADTVAIVGPATPPSVGGTFEVDASATGVSGLYAFQMDLTFDPTVLSAVSVTEGAFPPSGGSTFFLPARLTMLVAASQLRPTHSSAQSPASAEMEYCCSFSSPPLLPGQAF